MRDGASDVAHEARIPDYNLQLTAGTERNHSCYSAEACVRPTPAINLVLLRWLRHFQEDRNDRLQAIFAGTNGRQCRHPPKDCFDGRWLHW